MVSGSSLTVSHSGSIASLAGSLLLAVLLVLAGCAGAPAADLATTPESDTTTNTPLTTSATTSSATTSDETTAHATPSDVTTTTTTYVGLTTIDAESLSQSERELLRRAVENGSVTVTRANLSDPLTPDTDGWTVRYRGTRYELSWQYEGLRGEYNLDDATRVNASAVEPSDGVIAYENLTADARQLFDAARSGNDTDIYGAKAFPDQLQNNRYVTYDGEYYALGVTVGDYVVYRLTVTEVSS